MPAKTNHLYSAMNNVWDWLCQQPEYRSDYERWKKDVDSNKLLPFEIKKKSGRGNRFEINIVSSDYGVIKKGVNEEKYLSDAKRKYLPLVTLTRYLQQEKVRKKWGFYPLFDPDENFYPSSFSKLIKRISVGVVGTLINFAFNPKKRCHGL